MKGDYRLNKKCKTKHCRNDAAKGRTICEKCKSRLLKERHPVTYFFNALRNNARRRGKEFTLTMEEFKEFCEKTGYLGKKGKNGSDFSIDRKDHTKGYTKDNIQTLTLSENTTKHNIEGVPF